MAEVRAVFLIGSASRVRRTALSCKYALMRLQGQMYPDVYSVPFALAGRLSFLHIGAPLPHACELIFAELNASEQQLESVAEVIGARRAPVVVIPGPPEILANALRGDAVPRRRDLVRRVLNEADAVWVYARKIADDLRAEYGCGRFVTIPWIFDVDATRRIATHAERKSGRSKKRILLNAPLRFRGPMRNAQVLDDVAHVWRSLPVDLRSRVEFQTFIYDSSDSRSLTVSRAFRELPLRVAKRRRYRRFIRFIAGCDAVVNMTAGTILGRVSFLAAATARPGLWSANVELNRRLYPGACVEAEDREAMRQELGHLLTGVLQDCIDSRFLPDKCETARVGDAAANAGHLRELAGALIDSWPAIGIQGKLAETSTAGFR